MPVNADRGNGEAKRWAVSPLFILLLILAGLGLLLVPEGTAYILWIRILGIILAAIGILLGGVMYLPYRKDAWTERRSLAESLIMAITVQGRLKPLLPVFGILIIILDIVYNMFIVADSPLGVRFGPHDTIAIIFGGMVIAYNFIPSDFGRERDFLFIFFGGLVVILVIPLMLVRVLVGNLDATVNVYSEVMLAPQLAWMLNIAGVEATVVDAMSSTGEIARIGVEYSLVEGGTGRVAITSACSGIYSFSLFMSGFIAFVLTEYRRFTIRVGVLLVLGVILSYLANLFRMFTIVYGSHLYDTAHSLRPGSTDNVLQLMHAHMGWILFLLWISLFWVLMYWFIMKKDLDARAVEDAPKPVDLSIKKGEICQICSGTIEDVDNGVRCRWCRRVSHVDCIKELDVCPACNEEIDKDRLEEGGQGEGPVEGQENEGTVEEGAEADGGGEDE